MKFVHHLANFIRQVGHLKESGVGLWIHHQALVVARVLILRHIESGLLKCVFICENIFAERVELHHGRIEVFLIHLWLEKYVARVDAVATLFNQLNDVIAKFCFNNLAHLLRVVEVESHICIFRNKVVAALETNFTATHCRAVFRVKKSKS